MTFKTNKLTKGFCNVYCSYLLMDGICIIKKKRKKNLHMSLKENFQKSKFFIYLLITFFSIKLLRLIYLLNT